MPNYSLGFSPESPSSPRYSQLLPRCCGRRSPPAARLIRRRHTRGGRRVLDIGVLVFREGLECILVLAAMTANMIGARRGYQRPVAVGAARRCVATLVTWVIAVRIIDSLADSIPALDLQARDGPAGDRRAARRHELVLPQGLLDRLDFDAQPPQGNASSLMRRRRHVRAGVLWGLALLGFSSLYREGFEVVLFLQSYRLKLGSGPCWRASASAFCHGHRRRSLTFVGAPATARIGACSC